MSDGENRAARIVRLAASKPSSAQSWLRSDERGVWEQTAETLLKVSKDKAAELGLTESAVDEAVASELIIMALKTMVSVASKRARKGVS